MNSNPIDGTDPVIEQTAAAMPAESDNIGALTRRNTPSAAGYLIAAISALGIGSILVPIAFGGASNASDFLTGVGAVLAVGLIVVLVVGFPLILIAHLAVRHVERQSVHTATFGVVGLVAAALSGAWLFYPYGFPLPVLLAVAVSAAAGRATVNHRPR